MMLSPLDIAWKADECCGGLGGGCEPSPDDDDGDGDGVESLSDRGGGVVSKELFKLRSANLEDGGG